jgi:hypothetical protein
MERKVFNLIGAALAALAFAMAASDNPTAHHRPGAVRAVLADDKGPTLVTLQP